MRWRGCELPQTAQAPEPAWDIVNHAGEKVGAIEIGCHVPTAERPPEDRPGAQAD